MSGHTPGALSAAKEIVEAVQKMMPDTILRASIMIDKTAAVIDRETRVTELLEALKELHAHTKNNHCICGLNTKAENAIAKAEGKQ